MGSKLRRLRQLDAKPLTPAPDIASDDSHARALMSKLSPHVQEALDRGDNRKQLAYALLWLAHDVASGDGFGAALIPTLVELERIAEQERQRS
ncbi:MAG TPA: hypothetical protein VJN18_32300 [Polyangiaceae bacterium]|nr:hypothetical protein [Polyangiaceae bacterium]